MIKDYLFYSLRVVSYIGYTSLVTNIRVNEEKGQHFKKLCPMNVEAIKLIAVLFCSQYAQLGSVYGCPIERLWLFEYSVLILANIRLFGE